MGGGVAIFDYDNDGRMDLFFTNGALLKEPMPAGAMPDNAIRSSGIGFIIRKRMGL